MRAFIYISGIQILMVFTGLSTGTQKCHGNPRSYNNKRCASTTWYHDGRQGACGCGYDGADMQFDWSKSKFTAAANQLYFDNHKQWCGQTCGTCVNLTTTGGSAPGGVNTKEGQSHLFMIVDLCPNEAPNREWCSQTVNHPTNQYGYDAHFDLENGVQQITNGLNWDNVEVTYETVDCSQAHPAEQMTPSNSNYHQCECYKLQHGNR